MSGTRVLRNYVEAKDAFTAAARAHARELTTVHTLRDPRDGVDLDTQVALVGSRRPKYLLIHIAGTHGVEALPGSAIQIDLLRSLPDAFRDPDGDFAAAFVHLLNPWGTHNNRWANESNVNLMSNWTADPGSLKGAPKTFTPFVDKGLLNVPAPPTAYLSSLRFKASTVVCACTMGMKALSTAVGFPQYVNPEGVFFGGHGVEGVISSVGRYLDGLLSADTLEHVAIVDIHTGIGDEWGGSQTMCLRDESEEGAARIKALRKAYPIFRNLRTLNPALFKNSVHAYVAGLLEKKGGRAKLTGIHQDFGTYSGLRNMEVMSLENRHYHYSVPSLTTREKQLAIDPEDAWRLYCKSFFTPDDPKWWDRVVVGGRELVDTLVDVMKTGGGAKGGAGNERGGVRKRHPGGSL
ncbi:hypothetical protein DFJ74DRAFT_771302 [Hyaloraphidium curvatum]|nr:hypothetical protein DFJ74DRAFT_771302 [Hyaloraphidium curvatum]